MVQFGFSIFLIVSSVVVYRQMAFVRSREVGYSSDRLITIPNNKGLSATYRAIKQELLRTGAVQSSTKSNSPITEIYESNFIELPGAPDQMLDIDNIYAEYDYCKTMGIRLLEGRDFLESTEADSDAVLLNQAAIDAIGLKNPLNSKVTIARTERTIIGITENVLMGSPFEKIKPLYIQLELDWQVQSTPQNITIRLSEDMDPTEAIARVEEVFKKHNPAYPFEYAFADAEFDKKFSQIEFTGILTNIFGLIAVIIACLGLFGLAAFSAERRTKEFGIRRVLGATRLQLMTLLSNDFIRILVISFVVASPFVGWAMTEFLQRYTYHIEFNWLLLPVTAVIILFVVLVIVSTQAVKATQANLSETLRTD